MPEAPEQQPQRLPLFSLATPVATPAGAPDSGASAAETVAPSATGPSGGSAMSSSAFSLASSASVFGAKSAFGVKSAFGAQPAFSFAGAPPAATAPLAPLALEVRCLPSRDVVKVELPAAATVADAADAVRAQRPSDATAKGLTLLFAGTKLSCPTEALASLGLRSGHSLTCLHKECTVTPPLGRSLEPPPPPTPARAPSPGWSAVASSAAAGTSGGGGGSVAGGGAPLTGDASAGGPGSCAASAGASSAGASSSSALVPAAGGGGSLRVRFLTARELTVAYDPAMTGMGLKRHLEASGEGLAASLRLLCNGRECGRLRGELELVPPDEHPETPATTPSASPSKRATRSWW